MSENKTTGTSSRYDVIMQRYASRAAATAGREAVHRAFDRRAETGTTFVPSGKARLSAEPKAEVSTRTGEIHRSMGEIQMSLTELAETYGKLNVDLKNTLGKDAIYGIGDAAAVGWYTVTGRKQKARKIKLDAIGKRGDVIELLVNKMAEVLGDQYQKAVDGKTQAEALQVENVAHMKSLDSKLIGCLKGSTSTGADYAIAEREVAKLETELKEIDGILAEYERDIQAARTTHDLDKITALSNEMMQVMDIKHGVLDGRLAADGVVSNIRRELLDSAEGVQSAKGAMGASQVNYHAINALIDAMSELEIKYRHAKEDMIPVFKIQGRISAGGTKALELRDTLLKMANISQKLMEANAELVKHLATETFELLQTPLYDPERAHAVEEKLKDYMGKLNQMKVEWAENQQRVSEAVQQPHYAMPK